MASNNTRSMFFALFLCLGLSGAASAQSVASVSTPTVAPSSMPVTSAEAKEAAPAASTPEAAVIAPVAIDEAPEAEKGAGERIRHWAHSTVLYQRMYVRITLRSTPTWRAR